MAKWWHTGSLASLPDHAAAFQAAQVRVWHVPALSGRFVQSHKPFSCFARSRIHLLISAYLSSLKAGWCVCRLLPKRDPIALLADFPHVALSVVSNRRLSLW